MSENYLVFIEQPLIINAMKLVTSQIKGKCMRDCMTWSPEEQVVYGCNPVHIACKMYI
jgi:carotenoid cleavage dioxygenase-like enzyme